MQLKIKKVLSISILLSAVGLSMAACSNKSSSSNAKNADHSIALVTNNTGVDDHSFNQQLGKVLNVMVKLTTYLKEMAVTTTLNLVQLVTTFQTSNKLLTLNIKLLLGLAMN